jgi:hypothetical protein
VEHKKILVDQILCATLTVAGTGGLLWTFIMMIFGNSNAPLEEAIALLRIALTT